MEPVLLYITAPNREEAISLVHELLAERLIACANIMDHATSLYRWQGEIEQNNETVIFAKTQALHVEKITARVKEMHTYNCPCVVTLPITGGNADFLAWIKTETASA